MIFTLIFVIIFPITFSFADEPLSASEKAKQKLESLKEKNNKQFNEIINLKDDPYENMTFEELVDSKVLQIMSYWESFKKGAEQISLIGSIIAVIMGLIIAFLFRRDKVRKRGGYALAILGPIAFILIIYGEAIGKILGLGN